MGNRGEWEECCSAFLDPGPWPNGLDFSSCSTSPAEGFEAASFLLELDLTIN